MIQLTRRAAVKAMMALAAVAGAAPAGEWTGAVDVRHDFKRCVSYRARLAGEYLVVQAVPEPGWHTFAMDNKQRAEEKLAGRPALAVDSPTEISLSHGLEAAGPWQQSPPKDFSRPELQLFTWGFDGPTLFAAKVRRAGAGPAQIAVSGQACTETICKKIDVTITLPLAGGSGDADASGLDLNTLVRVRGGKLRN